MRYKNFFKIKKIKLRKSYIFFLLILLIGAFLRVYNLEIPLGFHGDEAWTGIEALRILKEGYIGIWSESALGQPTAPFYWTALFFKLFGESIVTARLAFSLLNIFWIPFFFLTTRMLFSSPVALVATFLLATGAIPLALARKADLIAVNFVLFPALYFFLKSFKTNKPIYYILTGIFMGLSHYIYAPFWITPLAFFLMLLYKAFVLKKKFFDTYIVHACLLFLAYFSIAFPMFSFTLGHSDDVFTRSRGISIFSSQGFTHAQSYLPNIHNTLDILLHNAKVTLLMFHVQKDPDVRNTFNTLPVFDPITGIFFLLGLLFALSHLKRDATIFLYFFLLFFLSGSIFNVDAPSVRRAQASIYLAYVFIGFGMIESYSILSKRVPLINKKLLTVIGILLLFTIGFYSSLSYFTRYAISQEAKDTNSYILVQAAIFIKTLPQPVYVYFYSSRWSYHYETLRFLVPDIPGEDRSSQLEMNTLINQYHPNKTIVHLFLPEYLASFYSIQRLYPNGKATIKKDKDGSIVFYAYIVPK